MSSAKITLLGFHKYFLDNNDDLFKHLLLPDNVDKDVVINNILLKGGEFEVLYSNPIFLQQAIYTWSKKWARTFNKWVEALSISYNPLENYDRMEEWTDKNESEGTSSDVSVGSGSSNTDSKVSAYNSNVMEPDTSSETSTENSTEGNTELHNKSESEKKGRAHGNIGVTTSQQMLLSELDDAATWNLYEHITDLFLSEFVLPVY